MTVFSLIWRHIKNAFNHIYLMIQRSIERKRFFSSVFDTAKNGMFTAAEKIQIQKRCNELDLTIEDFKSIRAKVFDIAFSTMEERGRITADQEIELNKIQQFFKIPNLEIIESKGDLKRIRIITEIQNGVPPSAVVTSVILSKGEVAYWSEPASLLEARVTGRRYVNGSRGVSLRLAKGVSYRFGNHPGHVVSEKTFLPISSGQLIITNKRILFNGDLKSFDLRLNKILGLNFADDGLIFSVGNRAKPYVITVDDPENVEIIRETLSLAMRNFDV